jgi:hypothetical protein
MNGRVSKVLLQSPIAAERSIAEFAIEAHRVRSAVNVSIPSENEHRSSDKRDSKIGGSRRVDSSLSSLSHASSELGVRHGGYVV